MKQLLEALDLALEALRLYQRTLAPTATQIKGEEAITAIKQARSAPEEPLMVDIHPPATQRDRWMYEQGRLAERDPRSHAAPVQEPAWYHAECDDPDYSRFTQEKDEAFAIVSDKGGYVTELYTRAQPAPVQEPVTQDVQEKCRIEVAPAKGGLLPAAPVQEPSDGTQVSKVWWDGEKLMAKPTPLVDFYQTVQDSTCSETLRAQGKAYPRTCRKCGLGPCIGAPKQPPAAQPDMAWIERERAVGYREGHMAALAQRQWVSLTADERYDIRASFRGRFLETSEFAEQVQLATEAKLKEKNA